jgi:uncharacterized LabA/DUF88 family protein
VEARDWVGTFFYDAPTRPEDRPGMAKMQQRFFSNLRRTKNVIVKLGTLEPRFERCVHCHKETRIVVQKGVDVLLAVDMIAMAMEGKYDDGYLVSADADFVPLVEHLRFALDKKVFCVSPKGSRYGKLGRACNAAIPIDQDFINGCQSQ